MRVAAALFGLLAATSLAAAPAPVADPATLAAVRARPPQDEVIYFLLPDRFANGDVKNDRGGLVGGRLQTGFDPTSKAFFNGGDLAGVLQKLDYIQGLGATAIWLAPVFRNKPVQGGPGQESAGYHGYWITDFTSVDPHLGSNDDLKRLVDAAHARGLKVYLDIVTNHTADVIQYRECVGQPCPYRSRADYPFSRKGGVNGTPINAGFAGEKDTTAENWAKLTRPDFAYTPFIPAGEERSKTPAWLNDPIHYHNRGETVYRGESSQSGDFVSLDDLATEHPRVLDGMIQIYGDWIDRLGIDGYRVDTAQHVNPEFWQRFVPGIMARARAAGIPNFHIFGEVSIDEVDVGRLARNSINTGMDNVLDFALKNAAMEAIAGQAPTSVLARLFADDVLYPGGAATAGRNASFISNHDGGRFAWFVRRANPQISTAELGQRTLLAHALLLFARGVPTLYAGDEQGFVGTGNDQLARQPLFASQVPDYRAMMRLGTSAGHDVDSYDPAHPFYRALKAMIAVRRGDPRLRHGLTEVRAAGDAPGLFAFARRIPGQPGETLVVMNTSAAPLAANVMIDPAASRWASRYGSCPASAAAPGTLAITLPPLGVAVCSTEEGPQ
ncbi:alpha-amylase family glycosyl hydrolase [Sandarakinorhabdus sp. AAP62]|uniref:alpha-amylase family glycosyl hydrolase n=1 Tax=Sandarakinorhabdus sp. AAP62 TaxID=1248916 RepID=UPI0002D90475|nr:alpha-amylase family glycosyl hydrolase [Sandarakinorhabdus sp. AAP62]